MNPTATEFAQAVEAVKTAPFGYTLEVIRFYQSKAVNACKVHANGPRMNSLIAEVCFWNEEFRKLEAAHKAAKDWSPAGAKEEQWETK